MNIRWWLARLLMWLRGERGCGGEGFTRKPSGHIVPCSKFGCH